MINDSQNGTVTKILVREKFGAKETIFSWKISRTVKILVSGPTFWRKIVTR